MNRVEIKAAAKELSKTNKWNVWKPMIVLGLVEFCVAFIVSLVGVIAKLDQELIVAIAEVVCGIALIPTTVGLMAYYLKLVRGKEFSLSDLKAYYPVFFKIFIMELLVGIFVTLWSMLLIIPGIIAAISYSMVYFICVDKEKLSAMETIKESKRLMNGYKLDYFVFNLSFIGWILLIPLTLGIAAIWVVPYITIADTMYYDKLKTINK